MLIKCADCGAPYDAKRKNALYCPFHRFMRDFMFARGTSAKPKKCMLCEASFLPVSGRQAYCGEHMILSPVHGACKICQHERQLVSKAMPLCGPCACDPKNNHEIHKLLHRQDQYLKHHNHEEPSNA